MAAPRLEIDLDRIRHNAATLVGALRDLGIGVTGVTKASLGSPEIARALVQAGVSGLGDSRVENLEALRAAGVPGPLTLIRAPMPSQVDRVVIAADVSCNSEVETLALLSRAAERLDRTHGVVLMVELGDLREGLLPGDVEAAARRVVELPGLELRGLGANLACQSGVVPDDRKMGELSALAGSIEATLGIALAVVSGGNSANLAWALGGGTIGRVNDLRLGESILLGRETLGRRPIPGLHTDAVAFVAEVIESKRKPSVPWGDVGQAAFGAPAPVHDRGPRWRTLVAAGEQDVDPAGLGAPHGMTVLGASSDHVVLDAAAPSVIGSEVRFEVGYSALLRAMTSPFVGKCFVAPTGARPVAGSG